MNTDRIEEEPAATVTNAPETETTQTEDEIANVLAKSQEQPALLTGPDGLPLMRPSYAVIGSSKGGRATEQWARDIEARLNAHAMMGYQLTYCSVEGYHCMAIMSAPVPVDVPTAMDLKLDREEAEAAS